MRMLTIALLLTLNSSCSIWKPSKPEPIDRPIFQPVECVDTALMRCDGVPKREYTGRKALTLGLGEALRALNDCIDRQHELLTCVAKHNEKAKAK